MLIFLSAHSLLAVISIVSKSQGKNWVFGLGSLSSYIHSGILLIQIHKIVFKILVNILMLTSHSSHAVYEIWFAMFSGLWVFLDADKKFPPSCPLFCGEHPQIALGTKLRLTGKDNKAQMEADLF